MPTYEYRCTRCGEHLEVFQSFSDDPLKRHKGCGGRVEKVFGSVGIVLKGSGFYRTDNRSGSRAAAEKVDADGRGSSDSSDSSDSSKPATPSETTTSDSKAASPNGSSKERSGKGPAKPGAKNE